MSENKHNMEDFLREKMDGFDSGAAPDWDSFEPKLERALMLQRMRQAALVSCFLILLGLGVVYTSGYFDRGGGFSHYQPRKVQQHSPVQGTTAAAVFNSIPARQLSSMSSPEEKTLVAPGEQKQAQVVAAAPAHDNARKQMGGMSIPVPANHEDRRPLEAGNEVVQTTVAADETRPQLESVETFAKAIKGGDSENLTLGKAALPGVKHPIAGLKIKKSDRPYISPLQEKNPWSFSLNVYPNFTFRRFEVDPEKRSFLHRDFIDAMQVSESGGVSLNIGLKISKRIGPITYINSGVEYISYKTEAYFNFTNFRDAQISPETGEILAYNMKPEPEQINFTDKNIYHYINLPLSISHQPWASDDIRLNIEAGGSLMYFLAARGATIDYQSLDIIDLSEREYRNTMGSFFMKVGATYHLNQKFNFGFEPTLMYFTNTIYTEKYPFRVIPYSVGMNLKLQVKLN